jgi:hypothetical protein
MGANQSAVDQIRAKEEMERIQKANAVNPDSFLSTFVPDEGFVVIMVLPDAYKTLSHNPHLACS